MIELHCLGPVKLTVNGEEPPAELLWRKHLALLVYLACSPRGRSRDHLIGLLWSDKDESKARHSLNEALRVIRRCVGDGLVTEGDLVSLAPGTVQTDLELTKPSEIEGSFLEGFSVPDAPEFEDWLVGERERVRSKSMTALLDLADWELKGGRPGHAREVLQRALELDPLHEPAACQLMRAYALEGARSQALGVYDRLAAGMDRDLGLKPDAGTRAVAERIREQKIVPGLPAATAESPVLVPMIGRSADEVRRLLELWSHARAGNLAVAVVRGDPGTGKTRLAQEMISRARLDGGVVASTRALEGDDPRVLWGALVRAGLMVPEVGGSAPEVLAGLAAVEPDVKAAFPGASSAEPQHLAEAIPAAIRAISEARPVLVLVDDAHHATDLVSEVAGLVERLGSASVMVVLTTRLHPPSQEIDSLMERVGRDVRGETITTSDFDGADLRELVRWAFPEYEEESVSRLSRRITADTGGNPFLAVELVRAVRAGLDVPPQEKGASTWPAAERTLDQTLPSELPASVGAALRLRYRSLSEAAQLTLAAIAVIGGLEPLATLARAVELEPSEIERALDELEWERWLVSDARGYSYVTKLAREVVLSDMVTKGQSRRMRERAGIR